jgi:hypothetical protein
MRARGMSQIEIARELQVSKQLISADVQYLRKQAKESIKEYVTQHLPEQYQICLCALDTILKHAYDIMQQSDDNCDKLQALELFKDTHLEKLDLLSNSTTIDSALNYIRSKQQQQQEQKQERQQGQQEKQDDDDDTTATTTTTTVDTAGGKQSVF